MPDPAARPPGAQPVVRHLTDLRADGAGWVEMTIPGSAPPVSLLRVHLDPATKASVSVVRFPAGWRRPSHGHYEVGEEFVVLEGELVVSGVRHRPGHVVYVPAGQPRYDSSSTCGALALAWFAGAPQWHSGAEADAALVACDVLPGARSGPPAAGTLRAPHPAVPGSSRLTDGAELWVSEQDRDLLWLETYDWSLVRAGQQPPTGSGAVMVREWGSSPSP